MSGEDRQMDIISPEGMTVATLGLSSGSYHTSGVGPYHFPAERRANYPLISVDGVVRTYLRRMIIIVHVSVRHRKTVQRTRGAQ